MSTDVFLFANSPYPPSDVILRPSATGVAPVLGSSFRRLPVPVPVLPVDLDDVAVALTLVVA